jgi:hypothetical protein
LILELAQLAVRFGCLFHNPNQESLVSLGDSYRGVKPSELRPDCLDLVGEVTQRSQRRFLKIGGLVHPSDKFVIELKGLR